jgi:hypothetical protein
MKMIKKTICAYPTGITQEIEVPEVDLTNGDLRISLNVSQDFAPGAESLSDWLRSKAKVLLQLADNLDTSERATERSSLELEMRDLGLFEEYKTQGFEITGEL